jgi:hypothetical protein
VSRARANKKRERTDLRIKEAPLSIYPSKHNFSETLQRLHHLTIPNVATSNEKKPSLYERRKV